jgi:hypothetical protein
MEQRTFDFVTTFPVTKRPVGRPRLYASHAARQAAYRQRLKRRQRSIHFRSEKQDYGTPSDVFDPLRARYGFTLDVCADASNAKCPRYFTAAEDGLAQDWGTEVCWMNPPYDN